MSDKVVWIGSGVIGFSLMFWGWFNIRRELHVRTGLCAFLLGCLLWAYAINTWSN